MQHRVSFWSTPKEKGGCGGLVPRPQYAAVIAMCDRLGVPHCFDAEGRLALGAIKDEKQQARKAKKQ